MPVLPQGSRARDVQTIRRHVALPDAEVTCGTDEESDPT